MHLGQDLGQVAIALIGDDDRGAGFGDQEIGAGDADIGLEELLAQHPARLVDELAGSVEVAVGRQMRVRRAEIGLDLSWLRCTAGAMMWLGCSPRSWMMYSPRSVSTGLMPASSSKSLRAISSVIIDLPLVTVRAPTAGRCRG